MALGYKVAIFNVWWRRGEVDTRFFSSKAEQKTYFDSKTLYFNDLNNFNMNDNITTVITFRDASGRSIDDLLKCNYAIVKDSNSNYRYFFITAIKQDSGGQIQCALDLDDIQNNLIGNLSNINPCTIKKYTGDNILYDSSTQSYLFNTTNELISTLKTQDNPVLYAKSSHRIQINQTGNDTIDKWLSDNIACWRYVFVSQTNSLITPRLDGADTHYCQYIMFNNSAINIKGEQIELPYDMISCPRYYPDSTKRIYIKFVYRSETLYLKLDDSNIDKFFTREGTVEGDGLKSNYPIGTYGFEEKISNLMPFDNPTTMAIDVDGDLIITAAVENYPVLPVITFDHSPFDKRPCFYPQENITISQTDKAHASSGIVEGCYLEKATYDAVVDNPINTRNISNQYFRNHKLLDSNYTRLRIRIGSQSFEYNPLAYNVDSGENSGKLLLEYSEVLKVGTSKIYVRLKESGFYSKTTENDYTGLVASLDLTEPLLNEKLADYLANNKNSYVQYTTNMMLGSLRKLISIGGKQIEGKGGGKLGLVGSLTGAFLDNYQTAKNYEWFMDDLASAPDSLSNANGDPYFNYEVSGIKPYLDLLQCEDFALKLAYDRLQYEGMDYNQIASVSTLFGIHHNYEALSFNINVINFNISEKEYERLKLRCNQLTRYWYSDTVDLESDNYIPI